MAARDSSSFRRGQFYFPPLDTALILPDIGSTRYLKIQNYVALYAVEIVTCNTYSQFLLRNDGDRSFHLERKEPYFNRVKFLSQKALRFDPKKCCKTYSSRVPLFFP